MFRWYERAKVCYAYLADVRGDVNPEQESSGFARSRWFTWGWTLQELIAPADVVFYSKDWKIIGTKERLHEFLSLITGIDSKALRGRSLELFSVAKKMSWAANRATTRVEDIAYSLLGIFDVNMPLLYGEGKKAFFRLQEEILKASSDQTLFAWGAAPSMMTIESFMKAERDRPSGHEQVTVPVHSSSQTTAPARQLLRGLLAGSPADFANSRNIEPLRQWPPEPADYQAVISHGSLRVRLPVLTYKGRNFFFAILGGRLEDDCENYLVVALQPWSMGTYNGRVGDMVLVPNSFQYSENNNSVDSRMQTLPIKGETQVSEGPGDSIFVEELPLIGSESVYPDIRLIASARWGRAYSSTMARQGL